MADRSTLHAARARQMCSCGRAECELGCDLCAFCRDDAEFIGTCQSCGAYWNAKRQPVCPCGGEVL